MEIISSLSIVIFIIAIAANFILAFFVYKNNPRSATNILFILLSFAVSIWLLAMHLSLQTNSSQNLLFWIKATLFLSAPMNLLFFLFSHTIPSNNLKLRKNSLFIIIFLSIFVMGITISPYTFTGVTIKDSIPNPIPGSGLIIFGIFSILINFATIYILIKKFRESSGIEKQQLRFIMIGVILMFSLIIGTIFLPLIVFHSNIFLPFFPLYPLIFIVMTAYSIIKYHLFNLKIITTEVLIVVIWIFLLSKIAVSASFIEKTVDVFILLAVIIFGILLIRSVLKEVKQREELKRLTKELEIKNEELKKLDEAKSQFVSITSHQLRTPLSTIKGYISMILEGLFGPVSKKIKPILDRVYTSNERLIILVRNLLNVSRIESGRIQYEKTYIDLIDLLVSVGEDVSGEIKKKGLDLKIQHVHKKLPRIFADSSYLRQVFLNLIDNAARYTQKGAIKINFDIMEEGLPAGEAGDLRDVVIVSVKDTGMGMNEAELNSIFRKFTRGETSQRYHTEGLGLGLFVAKEITEAHGGKIWAESEGKGKGSTFFVALPLNPLKTEK